MLNGLAKEFRPMWRKGVDQSPLFLRRTAIPLTSLCFHMQLPIRRICKCCRGFTDERERYRASPKGIDIDEKAGHGIYDSSGDLK
jgi:hypothetical protein